MMRDELYENISEASLTSRSFSPAIMEIKQKAEGKYS